MAGLHGAAGTDLRRHCGHGFRQEDGFSYSLPIWAPLDRMSLSCGKGPMGFGHPRLRPGDRRVFRGQCVLRLPSPPVARRSASTVCPAWVSPWGILAAGCCFFECRDHPDTANLRVADATQPVRLSFVSVAAVVGDFHGLYYCLGPGANREIGLSEGGGMPCRQAFGR